MAKSPAQKVVDKLEKEIKALEAQQESLQEQIRIKREGIQQILDNPIIVDALYGVFFGEEGLAKMQMPYTGKPRGRKKKETTA